MDWTHPFTANYRFMRVSRLTGDEVGLLTGIRSGGTIERNDDTTTRESATVDVEGALSIGPDLVRIWMDAVDDQTGEAESVALGTFVPQVSSRTATGPLSSSQATLYGRLKELDDDMFGRTFQVMSGSNAVDEARSICEDCGLEVVAEQSDYTVPETLTYAMTTDGGDTGGLTKLGVVNDLLGRAGFSSAYTDPMGRVVMRRYVEPADRAPSATMAEGARARFLREVTDSKDASDAANVVYAVYQFSKGEGDDAIDVTVVGSAYDYGPGDELSIAAMGRRVVRRESYDDEATQEQADAKAAELLATSQALVRRLEITHTYLPINLADTIRFSYPSASIDGKFAVRTQRIELGPGCKTKTEAKRYER